MTEADAIAKSPAPRTPRSLAAEWDKKKHEN